MPYYILAHYTIKDVQTFQSYPPAAVPTILQYGGKILVAAGPGMQEPAPGEGTPPHTTTVILEFESRPAFERWYTSPEYQAVIGLRTSSTEGWSQGLPGFEPPA